ncbi:hypothetical protein BH09PAT2_BH09PAT2_08920 [soil metagenome]
MKKYLIGLVAVLILITIIVIYFVSRRSDSRVNVSRTAVITELRELNRLETASFTIEKIVDAKTASNGRIQDFLFGDKLLLIAHGEVIAGIDLSKLQESNITIQEKTIALTLPAPEILVVSLDNTKTQVYDRQTGILSKGDKNLETEARSQAEQSIRLAACDGKILDEAAENARRQLTALFRTLSFETITISIPAATCK